MEPEAKKARFETPSSSKQVLAKEKEEARKVLYNRFNNGDNDNVLKEMKADRHVRYFSND